MAFRWIPMVMALTAGLAACATAGRGDPNTIRPITTTTPVTVAASTTVTTTPPTTSTSTSTTQSTTSTTQAEDPQAATKQHIADVVVAARTAFLEAGTEPVNPEDPVLATVYSGEKLKDIQGSLRRLQEGDLAYRRTEADLEDVTVVAIELPRPEEATAIACVTSDVVKYETGTGEIVNDDVGSILAAYFLRRDGSRWVVTDIQIVERFPGEVGCQ